jgi:hypothetical protein
MNDQAPHTGSAPDDGPNPDETKPIAAQDPADYPTPPPAAGTVAVPPPPPGGMATMTDDAPPPPPAAPPVEGPARPGAVGALTALGVGMLATAIVISSLRSREDGNLDWSNYAVGLGATAALLLVAIMVSMVVRRRDNRLGREELVTWPGTIGILGVAAMFSIAVEEEGWFEDIYGYVLGGIIAALAAIGFIAGRRAAFVVLTVFGLGIVYFNAFEDLFGDVGDSDDTAVVAAIGVAVFVVGATVLGWLLPTRATSGAAVAVFGVVSFSVIMGILLVSQVFTPLIGSFGMFSEEMGAQGGDPFAEPKAPDFDTDVWIIYALALGLTLLWALAAARTGHSGFTLSAIAMPAIVVPMGMFVLAVEHPTWWGVTVAAVGAVLLVGAGLLGRTRARRARERGESTPSASM